ncbi:MAG: nuclear transport factor 2 family protein [Sphingomonadaceae bacterium]|uniref:nuclear transport factor 2 family protein n=1 Tax=Thermaurantiacus sp. TaxID=2820283 RepID=UPI00298F124A|nr:nuclear transport factor 2 family protein [Thermaurantiacus sp.]MCS6986023.1 nuclear transport factor 2 family protein [Sphingomonadaceae bacterium]MDW8414761.1 nuclear transport factor 2 family protein [Thermaurantiacus sp.]
MTPAEGLAEVYARARARDWAGVEALSHPTLEIHEAASLPFGGVWTGRDAFRRLAEAVFGTWAEAQVEVLDLAGGSTWAVMVLRFTMTSKRTGRRFTQTVCEAGRFEDGLLRELRIHYFDTAEVAAEA